MTTGAGGATTTGGAGATITGDGGAKTTGGGGAYTTGAATAGCPTSPPKMPGPERIWLNTANAPSPSAASVDDPAIASAGLINTRTTATAKSFLMAFLLCPASFLAPSSGPTV